MAVTFRKAASNYIHSHPKALGTMALGSLVTLGGGTILALVLTKLSLAAKALSYLHLSAKTATIIGSGVTGVGIAGTSTGGAALIMSKKKKSNNNKNSDIEDQTNQNKADKKKKKK